MDWIKTGDREVGAWYWVTDGETVFPAKYYPFRIGGWTNEDTWEDFDERVIAWIKADVPLPPNKVI